MADNNVSVSINERRIGQKAGEAAGKAVADEMRQLRHKLDSLESEIETTNQRVRSLERQITDIERTKAAAQRNATEDLKDVLEEQYEEKKREYERRLHGILDDYRESITRLKESFIDSITDEGGEQFESVTDEFHEALDRRETAVERTAELGDAAAANHDDRLQRVIAARNEFLSAIDEFLEDRQDTAETIRSLQTSVPGVTGETRVRVPFWVVGIERDGSEEIRVLPVLDRGEPAGSPTREAPYADYLRPHPTHGYEDMVDAVRRYVARDEVRDALAERDGPYADPSVLEDSRAVRDRFVEAFAEYEFGRDRSAGDGESGASPSAGAERTDDREPAREREPEVTTDD